ncbi:hypothetical protein [Nitrosomonas communis]|uniref:hypothetical protein n=1 Tax=Nitrosomonas communis TaxID=44574 RepID=UPI001CA3162A|nr:hypothetical protein [Nitrosomonas communis]
MRTRTVTMQNNHVFMAIYALLKLKCLKIKYKANHFALRAKFFIKADQHSLCSITRNEDRVTSVITVQISIWVLAYISTSTAIGAGSVVTRDVQEGVLAVGNLCRVVHNGSE